MRRSLIIPAFFAAFAAVSSPAHAGCMAEYKAKSDNPLKLVYDVVEISGPCTVASANAQLQSRLASQGLTLLKVLSVKDQ